MKLYQYLASVALTATLMSGAMAEAIEPSAIKVGPTGTPIAAKLGKPMMKQHKHKKNHRMHKHVAQNLFAGLNSAAKVQKIAERAAGFYAEHGFVSAVEAYENRENKFFRPDANTYVVMYDSNGVVLAHPYEYMRARNVGDIPFVQTATNACWSGNTSNITYNWKGQNVVSHAVPVAGGNYCVVARTVG